MIIGHLPAGYIVSKLLAARLAADGVKGRLFVGAGMAGAIAPDVDMLYFYLVDQRQHHHHTYFTHFPVVWMALVLLSLLWMGSSRRTLGPALAFTFSLNGFIHLLLDSIVGDIWWLAPVVDRPFALFMVPALYQPWWLNFVLHWSFAFEIALIAGAAWLWQRHDTPAVQS
jgi:hypothetical protein